MDFFNTYKVFVDSKFHGVDKINDCCANNVSSSNKFIRIFKEYLLAQDTYTKSISKTNGNLAQLAKNKSDSFNPIFEAFSTTFCVFANVQKEFTESLSHIIKALVTTFENNDENVVHVLNSRASNIVANFKNAHIQLEKSRQKHSSNVLSNNDGSLGDERLARRTRENYETSIDKYNNMRLKFFDILQEGYEKSKHIQLRHLETMRKCVKSAGNALAKLMIDMKESIDSLKLFYRTNTKEDLFKLWVDSNKTVEDISINPFPKATLDPAGSGTNEQILIDLNNSPPSSHNSTTHSSEMKLKKIFQSRRNTAHIVNNELSIIDQDIPDTTNSDDNNSNNNKKNFEKTSNISALKSSKKKWAGLNILKRFQSTSDLVNEPDIKESTEECWQSKSNLNESVMLDDEGFIIRDTTSDSNRRLSESSSSNSSDGNRLRGIKVNIRPINNSAMTTASNSEVITAALQLPIPMREKMKKNEVRRVSNLQRSSRPISDLHKYKYSGRSSSVTELRNLDSYRDSPTMPKSSVIPIACAMTEIISSNDDGCSCNIQGQLLLALPTYVKNHLQLSSNNPVPEVLFFEFYSDVCEFSTVQVSKQYQDFVKLQLIDFNKYIIEVQKKLLQKVVEDTSLYVKGNRISFPLLEYSIVINDIADNIIDCRESWAQISDSHSQFDLSISSSYFEENTYITAKIKLLTDGTIEHVSSSTGNFKAEILNEQYWSIKLGKSDSAVSVKIKNNNCRVVKLRVAFEFVFNSCSLVMTQLRLKTNGNNIDETDEEDADEEAKSSFKISLIHYRTISKGNFSRLFDFCIS